MSYQAVLPLLPPRVVGRPDPDADALRCRSGVEYHEISTREALNRCTSVKMPFDWTLNPYRGCEFGCTYCYARYTHRFFDLPDWQDFETKIFVKKDAPRALRRQLRRRDLRGRTVAIGTATDPYQPAEHHYRVTRSLLEVFREAEGLKLEITTKSPLIARDLDLLAELDQRHVVSVNMTLTTVDPHLARRIERHAPDARARLRTVEKLTAEGIATTLFCMPLMPGINDGEDRLRPLMEAARDVGAVNVAAAPLFLRGHSTRSRFLPWVAEEFPHLARRYRALYSWRDYLRDEDQEIVLAAYRRLKLEYGFPKAVPGRG
jgi:DNA repair photolyase